MKLPHGRAASRAVADVRAELEQRVRARRSADQRGERGCEASALLARLDLGVDLQEARAALGDAAVHLRVRPAERLADLRVREALRLEHRQPEALQRPGCTV